MSKLEQLNQFSINELTAFIQRTMKPVLDTTETAEYLGVSVEWLKKARQTGSIEGKKVPVYVKVGKNVKYLRTDLELYLNSLEKHEHINY